MLAARGELPEYWWVIAIAFVPIVLWVLKRIVDDYLAIFFGEAKPSILGFELRNSKESCIYLLIGEGPPSNAQIETLNGTWNSISDHLERPGKNLSPEAELFLEHFHEEMKSRIGDATKLSPADKRVDIPSDFVVGDEKVFMRAFYPDTAERNLLQNPKDSIIVVMVRGKTVKPIPMHYQKAKELVDMLDQNLA